MDSEIKKKLEGLNHKLQRVERLFIEHAKDDAETVASLNENLSDINDTLQNVLLTLEQIADNFEEEE